MKSIARKCALQLIDAGARKKKWSPHERLQWTKAFNALQRLAGKKLVWQRGKMVKDG